MPRKLAVIAVTGLGLCVVCLGAAAVIDGPRLKDRDWSSFDLTFDRCKPVAGATADNRELEWPGGDKIAIAVPANVHYTQGVGQSIKVSGDPGMIAHLRVHHHTIGMDCDGGLHGAKVDIILPGGPFRSFTVAGSGKLDLNQIDQPSLELTVAGSGRIRADGKADTMKLNIAGSGLIEASGQTDSVRLKIAGSGDARLGQLAAKLADVDIAGSGDAEIAPRDEATIKIAGSGEVKLASEPKSIDTRIFGSGRIVHAAH